MFFKALAFSIFFFPSIFAVCPENGIKFQSKCYIFEAKKIPFVTADINCNNLGGHLASVHDGFTDAFLAQEGKTKFKNVQDFWIGASTLITPGNWSWTDGTPFDFSEWRVSKEKQQKSGQSCGAVNVFDGLWNSDDCFKGKTYVCETDDAVAAPTSPPATTTKATTTTTIPLRVTTTENRVIETTPNSPAPVANCSTGWQYFEPTASCYILTSTTQTWQESENECVSKNSHLASIHSSEELTFTKGLSANWNWVGLHSTDNTKGQLSATWKWTDSSPFDYAPWANNMPQGFSYVCVHAFDVIHNDWPCTNLLFGICKKLAYN